MSFILSGWTRELAVDFLSSNTNVVYSTYMSTNRNRFLHCYLSKRVVCTKLATWLMKAYDRWCHHNMVCRLCRQRSMWRLSNLIPAGITFIVSTGSNCLNYSKPFGYQKSNSNGASKLCTYLPHCVTAEIISQV